jgi:hypothetical protein
MIIHLQKIANEVELIGIETLAIHYGNLTILLQKNCLCNCFNIIIIETGVVIYCA